MVASRASPNASRATTTISQPEEAEAFAARKQILDQIDDAKPKPEQHQPADGSPEQRAPAKAAAHRDQRRIDRDRQ
jgi:hypothetical protein